MICFGCHAPDETHKVETLRFVVLCRFVVRCSDRANFFLNALVLYFYLEHVQRITFCRCFLIFNQAVFVLTMTLFYG